MTLSVESLRLVENSLTDVLARISLLEKKRNSRHDGAEFNEADHPRDADGKFSASPHLGLPSSEYTKNYKKSLGGKKPTKDGLIKFLLSKSDLLPSEIAAQAHSLYLESGGTGDFSKTKAAVNSIQKNMSQGQYPGLSLYGSGQTEKTTPVPSLKSPPSSSLLYSTFGETSTPIQKTVFEASKVSPRYKLDQSSYLEDHEGKEIRSQLKIDTKKIPGDFQALVTSAYGNNPHDGNSTSVDSAMDKYRRHQDLQLTENEKNSLDAYKTDGFFDINRSLLSKKEDEIHPKILSEIKNIRNVIKNSCVPADTPVFRGLKCSLKNLSGFDDPEQSIGRAFIHKNFVSCSRNPRISDLFGDSVILEFTLKAGTPGYILGSQNATEKEILLADKSIFRIDRVIREETPESPNLFRHRVHVTYLGVEENDV